jgi:hypothetical protein
MALIDSITALPALFTNRSKNRVVHCKVSFYLPRSGDIPTSERGNEVKSSKNLVYSVVALQRCIVVRREEARGRV